MTGPYVAAREGLDVDDAEPLSLESAYARAYRAALAPSRIGRVGLEIETQLVDLASPAETVAWGRVDPVPDAVGVAAGRSAISREPGGQWELSAPPASDILAAVTELGTDAQRVRVALAELGLGLAHVGADPVRPARRVNPRPRYQAMERHFAATGCSAAGAVMMNSTAAIQVNLDAGPRRGWAGRVGLAHRLGPAMVALSASSPWLVGRDTGWKSARQRAWGGLDRRVCGPVRGCVAATVDADADLDPAAAWAGYCLRAPVAFVGSRNGGVVAVDGSVPFERWVRGSVRLGGRAPFAADLDTHLTTLFPPVRLRGFLELRYLDMTAPRWWPATAAVVTTLLDDPVAADLAAEAVGCTAGLWMEAARDGLADRRLAEAARRLLRIAVIRVPGGMSAAVSDLAELVDSGRCPGDLLAERIARIGPEAAFAELARV